MTESRDQDTVIYCTRAIRHLWTDPLASQWHDQYPDLFDENDLRLAGTQPKYHFCEWFAAIHLFQRDGALSLVEKYVYPSHSRKVALLDKRMGGAAHVRLDEICARSHVQPPDLFVFHPDTGCYWFAEVKGPRDRFSKQQTASHQAINEELGVKVEVIWVKLR
jgi:hypothetical protein